MIAFKDIIRRYKLYIILLFFYISLEILKHYYPIFHILFPIVFIFTLFLLLLYLSKKLRLLTQKIVDNINTLDDNFNYMPPTSKICTFEDLDNLIDSLSMSIDNSLSLKNKYSDAIVEIEINEKLRDLFFLVSDRIISSSNNNLDDVYDFIIKKAIEIVPDAEIGSLALINSDNQLEFIASKGYDLESLKLVKLNKEDTFLWKVSVGSVSAPIIVRDVQNFNRKNLTPSEVEKLSNSNADKTKVSLSAPIYIDDNLIGTMNIDSTHENAFNEDDKKTIGFFTSLVGIALKNRTLMEESIYLSRHDKLTGIYNRRYFEELFLQFQEKSFTYGHKFSLILMDLNYLKSINDTFGHVVGDLALQGFVDRVKSHLRSGEVFTRFGGDEFILILPDTSYDQSSKRMEYIFDDFKSYSIHNNGVNIPIQFSYGISHSPDESMILDILVKIADAKMYEHKRMIKKENLSNEKFNIYHN